MIENITWKVQGRQHFYIDYQVKVEASSYAEAILEAYNLDSLEITPEVIEQLSYDDVDFYDAEAEVQK